MGLSCYKGQVCDNDGGVVVDHTLDEGNPPDAPQLAPAVARVIARTVVIPRKGRPGKTRQAAEHRPAFRKIVKWRTDDRDDHPRATQIDQQQLARELIEEARTEGVDLVGPDGLLVGLTKPVLETAPGGGARAPGLRQTRSGRT